jgi:hypothetical protein
MSATEYNFSINKGSIYHITFNYQSIDQQPINLTNWCARLSIQPINSTSKITYLTDNINPNYSFVVIPSLGRIELKLPVATTNSFDFNSAFYDLDLKAPNEIYPGAGPQIIPLLKGVITIISGNVVNPDPFDCNILDDTDECLTCE